jgi:lipopolysaccharide biosynthesis protein
LTGVSPDRDSDRVQPACEATPRARAIAFYLPQFHPIPENDAWWGEGFTEWTNVVKARPRFKGHYQPHLPGALGFYDLRLAESRIAQAQMASRFGIEGFCYYHYWFSGRRLLGRPLDEVRASGKPDLPFCLCWANQTWSRTWSGREHDVLVRQDYSDADHREHISWLADVFDDPRYMRVDGRPLFLIYLPEGIPDIARVVAHWKDYVLRRGSPEPYLCAVATGFSTAPGKAMIDAGFDAIVDFQPNRAHFPRPDNVSGRALSHLRRIAPARWYDAVRDSAWLRRHDINTVVDYAAYVERYRDREYDDGHTTFPCVFPSWDNSARRTAATIIQNDSADTYQRWLEMALVRLQRRPHDPAVVFINAWNEWAEGCHLEPDARNGYRFLEATRRAVCGSLA